MLALDDDNTRKARRALDSIDSGIMTLSFHIDHLERLIEHLSEKVHGDKTYHTDRLVNLRWVVEMIEGQVDVVADLAELHDKEPDADVAVAQLRAAGAL